MQWDKEPQVTCWEQDPTTSFDPKCTTHGVEGKKPKIRVKSKTKRRGGMEKGVGGENNLRKEMRNSNKA